MNLNTDLIGSEDPQRLVEYYTRPFGQPSCMARRSLASACAEDGA